LLDIFFSFLLKFSTLPILIYLGMKSSYTDIKISKIYNKDLLFSLKLGLPILVINVIIGILFKIFSFSIIVNIFINLFFVLTTGLIFWTLKLWAAGDAKLFLILSIILPINFFISNHNKLFPSFNSLVNSYIILIFFILIEIIASVNIKKIFNKIDIKQSILFIIKTRLKTFIILLINIIFIVLIVNKIRTYIVNYISLYFNYDLLYIYLIIFIIVNQLIKVFQNKYFFIISILGIIIYICINIYINNFLFINDFLKILSICSLIGILSSLINYYISKTDGVLIFVKDIKKNMILSNKTIFELKNKKKELFTQLKSINPEGLNEDQINILKNHYTDKLIEINKTLPFAPFLFIGIIISLFLNKNIIELLFEFIIKK
jgi:archaeal preflagellin peptidase FlaK